MTKRRYIEWDYRTNTVTEYERSGGCVRCGACCLAEITFTTRGQPRNGNRKNGGPTTDEVGVWQEVKAGRWRYLFKLLSVKPWTKKCPCLNGDDECDRYDDRHKICTEWPFSPACTAAFPECGYSFEEKESWRIVKADEHRPDS